MTLKCTVFGHKFGEKKTEKRRKNKDDNSLLVELEIRECDRCGETREKTVKTSIRDDEDSENVDGKPTDNNPPQQSNRSSNNQRNTSDRFKKDGLSSSGSSSYPGDEKAQGGVILEDNTNESDSTPESNRHSSSTTESDYLSTNQTEDDTGASRVSDDGSILYKKDDEDTRSKRYISCDSCSYKISMRESSRRCGDICKECGGWLEVEN